jgi:hypothetical protein
MFVDYQRDSAATRRFLRSDGDLAAAVRDAAEEAAIEAQQIIEAEAFQTGALAASVDIERSDLTGRFGRVGYAVTADDPAAVPIQYGNVHVPPGQVTEYLEEGARRAGLDIRGVPGD